MNAMSTITRVRASELANGFEGKRVIAIGDLMLDEFIWGRVRRISPEAPVPVVEVERQTLALGGTGNVASNLAALAAVPLPIGVVGDDSDAGRLRSALAALGIDSRGLVVDRGRPTTLKTRIIAHNQQVVRADRESRSPIAPETERSVLEVFDRLVDSVDAVVVSDYDKGVLTPRLLDSVLESARKQGCTVCLDPKVKDFSHYQPVTVITPNLHEAMEAAGVSTEGEAGVVEAGKRILDMLDCRAVLVTRGEEGMSLFSEGGEVAHFPTVAREVYDVTGAGDTVLATLGLALVAGATLAEAVMLANYAAGAVVGKVGTSTVTRQELMATIA
ncbi:MAG TPA: D-glycero-beta-D-manno-heptose-7-phosphate kinase [Blastocatellia bacterium]|nr:D-glycero-beta-D-manno-heptose-7-phosphate kinase [Blastocatellia bacterium]